MSDQEKEKHLDTVEKVLAKTWNKVKHEPELPSGWEEQVMERIESDCDLQDALAKSADNPVSGEEYNPTSPAQIRETPRKKIFAGVMIFLLLIATSILIRSCETSKPESFPGAPVPYHSEQDGNN